MIRQNIIKTNKVKVQRKVTFNQKVNNTISQKDKSTKQNTLESHGFKNTIKVKVQSKKCINKNYTQTYLSPIKELKDNEPQGDIMIHKREDYIRIFHININGLDLSKKGHSWLQLCQSLEEKGVDAIFLTETNVNWERQHLFNSFKKYFKKPWTKENLTTCTSNTNTIWKSDYKPGGTSLALTGRLSSAVINKGQDNSGLGRWMSITILGKNNNKTTIFNVYRLKNIAVELVENSTVIKQQWILLK